MRLSPFAFASPSAAMACSDPRKSVRLPPAMLLAAGILVCGGSADAPGGAGGMGSGGAGGAGGNGGGAAAGGGGGEAGAGASGGTGGIVFSPKTQEVLFVGGFMSELYESLSLYVQNELDTALQERARRLNVRIDLPLNQIINIPIGDAIADALPSVSIIEPGGFISFHTQEMELGDEAKNISDESANFDSIESNAGAILAYLLDARTQRKQITIVSHSKGGLDTLDALLRPEASELLGDTVVEWVALQAPFYGSPLRGAVAHPSFGCPILSGPPRAVAHGRQSFPEPGTRNTSIPWSKVCTKISSSPSPSRSPTLGAAGAPLPFPLLPGFGNAMSCNELPSAASTMSLPESVTSGAP